MKRSDRGSFRRRERPKSGRRRREKDKLLSRLPKKRPNESSE